MGTTRTTEPHPDSVRLAYSEVCSSYEAISDFRAKLLALLPLASGAGIFILLNNENDVEHIGWVGVFGILTTLGLFFQELRGIQHCKALITTGKALEHTLELDSFPTRGRFHARPNARFRVVGAEGAAWIIYPKVLAGWLLVALEGFWTTP